MATVSYTPVSDGTAADAPDINTPLAAFATAINGNIDSNNLAANAVTTSKITDGAVTTAKLNDGSVTTAKMALTTTTDANGWTIENYGTLKRYRKRLTFSQSYTAGSSAALTMSASTLPVGLSTLGTNSMVYSFHLSNDTAQFTICSAMTTPASALAFVAKNNFGSTLTCAGFVDIIISA